jgi:hypothetical protein
MEKKLTVEQIEYVFNYIASKDIKWYELQLELTDHMVSRMEEFWAKDPELTFHQVKQYAENEFGRDGFKKIEEERTQILQKEFNRSQRKIIGEYLKFPKIIASILAVILVYEGSFYFDDIITYIRILSFVLLLSSVELLLNLYSKRKINGKRFLSLDITLRITNSAIFGFYCIVILMKSFKEIFQQNHLLFIPFSCIWVLGILVVLTGRHLKNKIVCDIKKQYQLI